MRLEENVGAPRRLTPAESAALPPMLPDDSDDGNDDDSDNDDIIFGDQIPTTAPGFDQQITTPPQFDTSIVADREQDLLRREERMQQNRQERRRLLQRIDELENEFNTQRTEYRPLLRDTQQIQDFDSAVENNSVELYVDRTRRMRNRTTIPRTNRQYSHHN